VIREITQYIANNLTTLVIGTNLFAGFSESDAPDSAVIVGEPVPGLADGLLTDKVQKPIRILVRDPDHWAARDTTEAVYELLHGLVQTTLPIVDSGLEYCVGIVCNTPFFAGQDAKGNHQFSLNMEITSQEV
jgi:hypothetical protein